MLYVVSYDISQDASRTRLLRDLRGLGVRVQYSVVECLPKGGDLAHLAGLAEPRLGDPSDSVRIYPVCRRCRDGIVILGAGEITVVRDSYTT